MKGSFIKTVLLSSIIILYALVMISCSKKKAFSEPVIKDLGQFSVEIEFSSTKKVHAQFRCFNTIDYDMSLSDERSTRIHRFKATGLAPGKLYYYTIDQDPENKYYFRTKPQRDSFFRFIVYDDTKITKLPVPILEHYPDFIITQKDINTQLASYLPVYVFASMKGKEEWARSVVVFHSADTDVAMRSLIDYQTVIIISSRPLSFQKEADKKSFIINIILAEKAKGTKESMGLENIKRVYIGKKALLFEVNGYDIVLDDLFSGESAVLRSTPIQSKRTCLYCRRLLEAKKYEESIKWYKEFIAHNSGNYQVDEAVYMIATIYDKNLFDYPNALIYYKKYMKQYPDSHKVPMVRARLSYITANKDHDFKPLKAFESAKSSMGSVSDESVAERIIAIRRDFPQAAISDHVLFWLSNFYEGIDTDRSITLLDELIGKFPGSDFRDRAYIQKGIIAYRYARYRDALTYYTEAGERTGEEYEQDIALKIKRTKRNIRRQIVYYAACILLALFVILAFYRYRFDMDHLKILVILLVGYSVSTSIAAIFIPELFRNYLLFMLLVCIGNSSIPVFLMRMKVKTAKLPSVSQIIVLLAMLLLLVLCINYILFYKFHLLYIFGV
ncbi:tol-pal system YbgF family protein [Spirochaetota bacterium]